MTHKNDNELILFIREGDVLAYEELVKRYQRGLYAFVFRIIHDEAASHDIVIDTLYKVYQNIDTIDVTKKFSTYVFEIAKNASFSFFRSHKHHASLEDIAGVEAEESFLEQLYRGDSARDVRTAVSKLEKKYRNVIRLYYFEDLSYEEVGKKLRLPINTVRTHLSRAKQKLKILIPYEKR